MIYLSDNIDISDLFFFLNKFLIIIGDIFIRMFRMYEQESIGTHSTDVLDFFTLLNHLYSTVSWLWLSSPKKKRNRERLKYTPGSSMSKKNNKQIDYVKYSGFFFFEIKLGKCNVSNGSIIPESPEAHFLKNKPWD